MCVCVCVSCLQLAVDSLGWSTGSSKVVMEGHVKFTQPSDLLLTATRGRSSRTLKWQNVWLALIVLNHQVINIHQFHLNYVQTESFSVLIFINFLEKKEKEKERKEINFFFIVMIMLLVLL